MEEIQNLCLLTSNSQHGLLNGLAAAAPGNLLEMHNLRHHLSPPEQSEFSLIEKLWAGKSPILPMLSLEVANVDRCLMAHLAEKWIQQNDDHNQ